ncbi:MAG: DUF6591 domain-containing protein [Bacillota bacterium]|jgi:hypothetical protein
MKKIWIALLLVALMMSFTACGAKEKLENKVGEAIGEKILEEIGGGDVDIDGDKVTIKGEDGTEASFGGSEWPESDVLQTVPEFKEGTITSVMTSEAYAMIIIEEVKEQDFAEYYDEIKASFTKDAFEMNLDGIISYAAGNDKGISVQLSYDKENQTVSIAAGKAE